jgi:hypothetical protein
MYLDLYDTDKGQTEVKHNFIMCIKFLEFCGRKQLMRQLQK